MKHGDVHKEKETQRNIEFFWKGKHLDVKRVSEFCQFPGDPKHHLKSWFEKHGKVGEKVVVQRYVKAAR